MEQGKRYRLSFKLWSQSAATIKLIVGESQEPWTNYWNQLLDSPADALQRYSYDFTMSNNSDSNAGLFFHVGGHTSPVLCVDQISLIALNNAVSESPVYLPLVSQ